MNLIKNSQLIMFLTVRRATGAHKSLDTLVVVQEKGPRT